MEALDIAIPTCGRSSASFAVTLATILGQTYRNFRLLISDQGDDPNLKEAGEIQALLRVFEAHGNDVLFLRRLSRKGMAEQRDFLLSHVAADKVLFLDDDLILESDVVERLVSCINVEQCGFVGCAAIGLSFAKDFRPDEQKIEIWEGPVRPERIEPKRGAWWRYKLHNAANLFHVQRDFPSRGVKSVRYKVAWVGGCVLYDVSKLKSVGAFSFWRDLPPSHCGEDVLAQLRVMAKFGGCGILPSGVYHQELPTTVPDRTVNAPEVLPIVLEGEAA